MLDLLARLVNPSLYHVTTLQPALESLFLIAMGTEINPGQFDSGFDWDKSAKI